MNLSRIKNIFADSYSLNLIFLNENYFQDEKVRTSPQKWTSKFENALFWSACQYSHWQSVHFSSNNVDFHARNYQILRVTWLNFLNGLALLSLLLLAAGAHLKFHYFNSFKGPTKLSSFVIPEGHEGTHAAKAQYTVSPS